MSWCSWSISLLSPCGVSGYRCMLQWYVSGYHCLYWGSGSFPLLHDVMIALAVQLVVFPVVALPFPLVMVPRLLSLVWFMALWDVVPAKKVPDPAHKSSWPFGIS